MGKYNYGIKRNAVFSIIGNINSISHVLFPLHFMLSESTISNLRQYVHDVKIDEDVNQIEQAINITESTNDIMSKDYIVEIAQNDLEKPIFTRRHKKQRKKEKEHLLRLKLIEEDKRKKKLLKETYPQLSKKQKEHLLRLKIIEENKQKKILLQKARIKAKELKISQDLNKRWGTVEETRRYRKAFFFNYSAHQSVLYA